MAVTVAPGSTPPCASVMIPARLPVVTVCADADAAATSRHRMLAIALKRIVIRVTPGLSNSDSSRCCTGKRTRGAAGPRRSLTITDASTRIAALQRIYFGGVIGGGGGRSEYSVRCRTSTFGRLTLTSIVRLRFFGSGFVE